MVAATTYQSDYINLYRELRNYVWPYSVVAMIADLEVEVYQAFPDVTMIENHLSKLDNATKPEQVGDEEMKEAFDLFYEDLKE